MHYEVNSSAGSGNIFEVKNNQVNKFSVDYAGNVTAAGNITGAGGLTLTGDISVDDLTVTDDAAVTGDLTVGATLAVTGAAATGALTVTGAASVSTNLTVSGGQVKDVAGLSRILFAPAKTIVDGAPTTLFTVPIAAAASIGGMISFHVFASDATDHQSIQGVANYASVNKAGTLTSTITYTTAPEAKAVSSGTLTLAFTMAEDSADVVSIKLEPTGSLTETVYNVVYTVFPAKGAVTIV